MQTRTTSMQAYKEILQNGLLSKKRLAVYECILKHGPITGAQAAVLLSTRGKVSETVRNRITELVQMGAVYEVKQGACPITGRNVLFFDVTGDTPKAFVPKKTTRDKLGEIIQELRCIASSSAMRDGHRDWIKKICFDLEKVK